MCKEADGILRVARAPEVDQPGAVREVALERARRLDCEPALAHPRRAGERHEAMLAEERGDLAEVILAADIRGRRRGRIAAAPTLDRHRGDRRVVREDRLLKPPELGPGSSPNSSASTRRASWKVSSESAWRPLR